MSEAFADAGLRPQALCPAYGLAESTLVVSCSPPEEEPRFVSPADIPVAERSGIDLPTRRLVSCGRIVEGAQVRIRGPLGEDLPEGSVGQIHLAGPWISSGYWQWADDRRGDDGALATGDLGFVRDGEVFICGRTKDMIIVGGRNLYPKDYEEAAELVDGIRSGNVIAFSLPDTERMVIVAEGRGDTASLHLLAQQLRERLRASTDHAPEEVVLVRSGTLPKTSSGKRQRRACRDRYLSGELQVLHALR